MIASFGRSGSSEAALVTVFANAACGLEAVAAIAEPKRMEEELVNHDRRVDGSALRDVEEQPAEVALQLVVLKAPAAPNADDSNSSVDEVIFMVEYYESTWSSCYLCYAAAVAFIDELFSVFLERGDGRCDDHGSF